MIFFCTLVSLHIASRPKGTRCRAKLRGGQNVPHVKCTSSMRIILLTMPGVETSSYRLSTESNPSSLRSPTDCAILILRSRDSDFARLSEGKKPNCCTQHRSCRDLCTRNVFPGNGILPSYRRAKMAVWPPSSGQNLRHLAIYYGTSRA